MGRHACVLALKYAIPVKTLKRRPASPNAHRSFNRPFVFIYLFVCFIVSGKSVSCPLAPGRPVMKHRGENNMASVIWSHYQVLETTADNSDFFLLLFLHIFVSVFFGKLGGAFGIQTHSTSYSTALPFQAPGSWI